MPAAAADPLTRLLDAGLRTDPSRPVLTFFDDATGERSELSRTTLGNWVAKTGNFLQDALALEPGARVAIALPLHWQGAVWLAACWAAGVVALPAAPEVTLPDAEVLVVDAALLPRLPARGALPYDEVVGLALRPLALPGPGLPAGVIDYDVEVRGHGDVFTPYAPPVPSAPALVLGGRAFSREDLAARAATVADRWGLTATDRVLSTEPLDTEPGLHAGLLAPLAVGASAVLCRNVATRSLAQRLAAEAVTAVTGGVAETKSGVRALPWHTLAD